MTLKRNPLHIGLYEKPVTNELNRLLADAQESGLSAELRDLDQNDGYELLAQHIYANVRARLSALPAKDRVKNQLAITNQLLAALGDSEQELALPLRELQALTITAKLSPLGEKTSARTNRPRVPLSQSDLLVNARGEPSVGQALLEEIVSADRVDLLCAFIRWNGIRILLPALKELREEGRQLRVITTTYVGATERKALDELVRIGAEIKISYERQSTRLHAKAWLLKRETGFSTAYIGSSNLSKSALLDGLEWNVRLSQIKNPDVLEKFEATFDAYWQDPSFERYDPDVDGERLDGELHDARFSGGVDVGMHAISTFAIDVNPYPHQREILETLMVERSRHHRHKNLVVAATGSGKTVIAALDYRRLSEATQKESPGTARPSLLFVAHRKEILQQSLATFRAVLRDFAFGELYVDGHRPDEWRHVFASIQSLSGATLELIDPGAFDIVIVDEFHHAAAKTYGKLLDRVEPRELLGLTATPERTDGQSVLHWFDGRISAELRLWEALARQILCPFQYFAVSDGVDLDAIAWKRGGYDSTALSNVYTGNDARVRLVLHALLDKVTNVREMRALGFCVSVEHAEYMATKFMAANISAMAVSASTPADRRAQALRDLKQRKINIIFAVDLFNEGVDIPEVDTVLFLRPTESATIFIQQLGRGLRHSSSTQKSCLTVLDFVGKANRSFRYDRRYRALTGESRRELVDSIENGFGYLPSGCVIQLDRVAKEVILENIKRATFQNILSIESELRALGRDVNLAKFLHESDMELEELYGASNRSWTDIRRRAGLPTLSAGPDDASCQKAVRRVLHWDDPLRLSALGMWLSDIGSVDVGEISLSERRMLLALGYQFFRKKMEGWRDCRAIIDHLKKHPAYCQELSELAEILENRASHIPIPIGNFVAGWDHPVPLQVHCRYSLDEVLFAMGNMSFDQQNRIREGVVYDEETKSDYLFVTLEKTESHYSPTTMYKDYAISSTLFHWESQSGTNESSPTGARYINHRSMGNNVFLFIRNKPKENGVTQPYWFVGPVEYVRHVGERPMQITWKLFVQLPEDVFSESKVAAG